MKSRIGPLARLGLLALLLGLALLPAAPLTVVRAASTLYVAPGGNNANNCLSPATPCLTIAGTIGKASAGDTINIAAGTYKEILSLSKEVNLTGAGANVTFIDGTGANSSVLVLTSAGTSIISSITIQNGNSPKGGAIKNDGTLTLNDSVISANVSGSSGGGIWSGGTLTLSGSTISGNTANGDGGGIYNNSGTVILTNTTITGNRANSNSQGGAIYTNGGSVTLNNVTVAGNIGSKNGGGIYNNQDTSTVNLHNTILSGNSTGGSAPDCYGKMTSQGYNLIKSTAGCTISGLSTGNITGQDAGLGPLQNNGGRTPTMLPQPGSPAIDHGNACAPGDQRGAARPAACDIGAYEAGLVTWYVSSASGGDGNICGSQAAPSATPCKTIGEALVRAVSGETIKLDAGVYPENITLAKSLSIAGAGADTTTLDGGAGTAVITINSGTSVTISALTIGNSQAAARRGIANSGDLKLSSVKLSGNISNADGGGILNTGTLTINSSMLIGNKSTAGSGGAIFNSGSLTINGGAPNSHDISANQAALHGGAIFNSGTLIVNGGNFNANQATINGGAIASGGGSVSLSGSTLDTNAAGGSGGAIFTAGGLSLSNSVVANNHANGGDGGGILASGGTLANSSVYSNSASGNGGGIANNGGSLTLAGMTIGKNASIGSSAGNSAGANGGGVSNSGGGVSLTDSSVVSANTSAASGGGIATSGGTVTLASSAIGGNSAGANGGGVSNSGGALALTGMTLDGNQASGNGGGVASAGLDVSLANSTFSNNKATTGAGGAIWNGGVLVLSASALFKNSAASGGAIANDGSTAGGASLMIVNTTLNGNTASSGSSVTNLGSATLSSNNNTISGNTGGIANTGGAVNLSNTILAGNAGGAECSGTINSQDYNLFGAGCSVAPAGHDQTNIGDPQLFALQDNGGPTQTMAPKNGSPAIDKGNPASPGAAGACAAADQRGVPRPVGNFCDVGAYERGPTNISTWYVDPSGNNAPATSCKSAANPCRTIGEIVNNRSIPGDTIMIAAGAYNENLTLTRNVTLIGAGADVTSIRGSQNGAVIAVNLGVQVSITGLAVRGGAGLNGDGIANSGDLTVTNGLVGANNGRGILNSGTLTLDSSAISGNTGAGLANSGTATLRNSGIDGNSGGGITNSGALTLDNSQVTGNSGSGGIATSAGTLNVTTSSITGNSSTTNGGGIAASGGTLTLSRAAIKSNSANGNGGGVYNNGGAMSLINSGVQNNSATASGGGLYAGGGSTDVQNSTLAGNTAAVGGGIGAAGALTLKTSTVANNQASGQGGGVQISGGVTTIANTTIAGNTAANGGGIANGGGTVNLSNTIVAGSAGGAPDCAGTVNSQGHNLLGNGAGCGITGAPGDQINAGDPKLGTLQSNGGLLLGNGDPLLTMAPLPSSPAVNAGDTSCGEFDQRGVKRPQVGVCDIGAIELEPLTPIPEVEPNDQLDSATPLQINGSGYTARSGTISTANDIDLYRLTAQPGAQVTLNLTQLPADYDILLVYDPRATDPYSDSGDLRNITDFRRKGGHVFRRKGGHVFGSAFEDNVIAYSDERKTNNESIDAFLREGGQYFVMIFGYEGAADSAKPYRLDVTLRDGTLIKPAITASEVVGLNGSRNDNITTIYLYNSQRMSARYSGDPALGSLLGALQPGQPLMTASSGIAIDLGGASLLPADASNLSKLYDQWDKNAPQPLLANEVAQKIWLILQRAIDSYYPNTANLVIVGDDEIIPFYRVPDEMTFGNERDYHNELQASGAYRGLSPLAGNLFYNFVESDNFYADRAGTPWRGRALYIPDIGIGRLVEKPSDIWHYLNSYLTSGNNFTINAGRADRAALVTGYSYLTDNAERIADTLDIDLLDNTLAGAAETAAPTARVKRLIDDSWDKSLLAGTWLPGLADGYASAHSPYDITAINGHFNHDQAIPANLDGGALLASQIYRPTVSGGNDMLAYFKIAGAPTLLFSVGCHSGLSVPEETFNASAPHGEELQVDFPQAVLKQGGNWIGNSGFGYGDTGIVGYSERLALLFTEAIGRRVVAPNTDTYIGATIGESLARAKRQYLQNSGSASFSVTDEKVLEQWTLYGLPFIRVKVANPARPEYGLSFDPVPQPVPAEVISTLDSTQGLLTRVITLTNTFKNPSSDKPPEVSSIVEDSFLPGQQLPVLIGSPQTTLGSPVLPLLTYDITLKDTGLNGGAGRGVPIPRGVQMRSATTLQTIGFNPRITTLVTDEVTKATSEETQLETNEKWLPELPYTFLRTSQELSGQSDVSYTDKLLVIPAQFIGKNNDNDNGHLRRFSQMVFEITYVDPNSAPQSILDDQSPPTFETTDFIQPGQPSGISIADVLVTIRANVSDDGAGIQRVSATYTVDGRRWQRVDLAPATGGEYSAAVLGSPVGGEGDIFFEVVDKAGNVSIATRKSIPLLPFNMQFIPMIRGSRR